MLNAQSMLKLIFLSAWILTLATIAFGNGDTLHPARTDTFALSGHGPRGGWSHLVAVRAAGVIAHGHSSRQSPARAVGPKAVPV